MNLKKHYTQYIMDRTINPPSFLPEYVDTSELEDITCIGDSWRKYLNPQTGRIHDGAWYIECYERLIYG